MQRWTEIRSKQGPMTSALGELTRYTGTWQNQGMRREKTMRTSSIQRRKQNEEEGKKPRGLESDKKKAFLTIFALCTSMYTTQTPRDEHIKTHVDMRFIPCIIPYSVLNNCDMYNKSIQNMTIDQIFIKKWKHKTWNFLCDIRGVSMNMLEKRSHSGVLCRGQSTWSLCFAYFLRF